jgi:hypothetical protein
MAGLLLAGRLHSFGLILLVVMVGVVGSVLGAVHGSVLGYLGRPAGPHVMHARHYAMVGGLAAVACLVGVCLAVWLVVSAMAVQVGDVVGQIAMIMAALTAFAVFAWATVNGWHALDAAYRRWPEKRMGTALVLGAFVILLATMQWLRGGIPGTEIQLSAGASLVLVALAVLWIVSPAVILGLRVAARARSHLLS